MIDLDKIRIRYNLGHLRDNDVSDLISEFREAIEEINALKRENLLIPILGEQLKNRNERLQLAEEVIRYDETHWPNADLGARAQEYFAKWKESK